MTTNGATLTTGSLTTRDLDLEIHSTQGGGLKDMSRLCLATSQRHTHWPRLMGKGLAGRRETSVFWLTIDITIPSLHQSDSSPTACKLNSNFAISKMPRTPPKPTAKVEFRPYPSSSPPSNDSSSKDTGSSGNSKMKVDRKGPKGVWTAEEQKQLLHFAINRNGRGWGEAVPGKTANQASCLWS